MGEKDMTLEFTDRDIEGCNWNRLLFRTITQISNCKATLLIAPFHKNCPSLDFIGEFGAKLVEELFLIPGITALLLYEQELAIFTTRDADGAFINNGVENIFEKLLIAKRAA